VGAVPMKGRRAALATFMSLAALAAMLGLHVVSAAASTHADAKAKPTYYLNLGDSYAEGYQPGYTNGSETLHGYANRLVKDVAGTTHLHLENFGCGGATTTSLLNSIGCAPGLLANDGVPYPTTSQFQAVQNFVAAHRGKIALITISIGGNDFDRCITSADPISCVTAAVPIMKANVTTMATELRQSVGPHVPVIAITYPDVALGAWMSGASGQAFAKESILAFKAIINPALKAAYALADITLVDITTDTGAYIPLTKTTTLKPYGTIPVAVADVCTDTWFCALKNIHPTNAGYTLIAAELTKAFDKIAR
jgi:lysophospholipase L1-like esterase